MAKEFKSQYNLVDHVLPVESEHLPKVLPRPNETFVIRRLNRLINNELEPPSRAIRFQTRSALCFARTFQNINLIINK